MSSHTMSSHTVLSRPFDDSVVPMASSPEGSSPSGDRAAAVALLRWYVEMGADEAIAEAPVNRLAPAAPPPALAARPATRVPPPPLARAIQVSPPAALADSPGEAAQSARLLAGAADTIVALEAAIAGFDGCALKRTATNTVVADGNPAAAVMIIGEAPGADEDRIGRPFVGRAGQLLDRM
ncbi:MAG: uracil-DNA glycosylase family protein, partial [Stellaceae bacterium]